MLFVGAVVAFFITMAILSVIVELTPSGTPRLSTLAAMLLAPAALLCGTIAIEGGSFQRPWDVLEKHDGPVVKLITGGIAVCAAQLAIIAVSLLLMVITDTAVTAALAKRRPDIRVTGTLITLLRNLHKAPYRFDTVRVKGLVCQDLEHVAVYVQTRLPGALALSDSGTRESLRQRCADAAAYLRQLQVRVALSDASTVSDLRVIVAHYVAIFTVSEYGLLPAETAAGRRGVLASIFRVTRTLVLAVIPIGCLIAARKFGVTLARPVNDEVVLVTLLWAAINLVSIIDPAYRARIEDMNNVVSIFKRDG